MLLTTGFTFEHVFQAKEGTSSSQTAAVFHITVDDPQKVGDPIRPYIMYTVHTRVSPPIF